MEGEQVNRSGNKGKLRLIGEVHAPNKIVDGLVAIVDLVGDGPLPQIHEGGADVKVLREGVVQVGSEEILVCAVFVFRLPSDVNGGSGVEVSLVDDGDSTHVVVDGIVHIFLQGDTASGNFDRALRHIRSGDSELGTVGGTVGALDIELVLVGDLLRHRLGHRVEGVEGVFVSQLRFGDDRPQVFAERLNMGEIDAAVSGVDGTSHSGGIVDEVENTIRVGVLLLVQTVQTQQPDQWDALLAALGEETVRHTLSVTRVENIQTEFLIGNLISRKAIHVLHHEFPEGRPGVGVAALQQLHADTLGSGNLIGEFTDLIDFVVADDRVLEGNGQHLV